MNRRIVLLRGAIERLAEGDAEVTVEDANVETNGSAFKGGFVVAVQGSVAQAQIRVGEYHSEIIFMEYSGNGSSIHPALELKEEISNEADADQAAIAVLERVKAHVNRYR
jgi:hypothetical protein